MVKRNKLLAMTGAAVGLMLFDGAFVSLAKAQSSRIPLQSRAKSTPVLAVVALHQQHVSIYDANGKIMEAPISSGQSTLETPPGIYSVVQKEEDHHSNVYDDASMPFMERITWTGIALHAGVLPGVPASHGCVRMPIGFAQQLYQLTNIGMRVVVVREDITPASIAQPFMFSPHASAHEQSADGAGIRSATAAGTSSAIAVSMTPDTDSGLTSNALFELQSTARMKVLEADTAGKRYRELRQIALKKAAEMTPANRAVALAEASFAKAEADLRAADKSLEAANIVPAASLSPASEASTDPAKAEANAKAMAAKAEAAAKAETARLQLVTKLEASVAQAMAKVESARTQVGTAKSAAQEKADASAKAQADVKTAETSLSAAIEASEKAKQDISPVSVFISRKTQRLYIRKGMEPVYEGPVTIRDADKPIGSFVFTAVKETGTPGELSWTVTSMYKNAVAIEPYSQWLSGRGKNRKSDALPADVNGAQDALSRLDIPQEAFDRISEVVLPGSSLIISDESLSIETGKDTDFVVIMSGDPQGGITIRQHSKPQRVSRYDEDDDGFFGSRRSSRRSDRFDRYEEPRRSRGFFFFGD